MQIILSEKEFREFEEAKKKLYKMENKIKDIEEIIFNNDGNFIKHIMPTIDKVILNKDKIIELVTEGRSISLEEYKTKLVIE